MAEARMVVISAARSPAKSREGQGSSMDFMTASRNETAMDGGANRLKQIVKAGNGASRRSTPNCQQANAILLVSPLCCENNHMFKFPPAATDYFKQTDTVLDGRTKLVQALRGFVCRFTILLYNYKQWRYVQAKLHEQGSSMDKDQGVMYWFLDHTLRDSAVIHLRSLCDSNIKSLGARSIADGLNDPVVRAGLCAYLDAGSHARSMTDAVQRERYLDYIAKYMRLLSSNAKAGQSSHDIVMKVSLIRRWANKTIAHPTLDDYKVDSDDLLHIFLVVAVLATAIEAVMGDAAVDNDLQVCGEQAERGSAVLLGSPGTIGTKYIQTFRELLPEWVHSGKEFPLCQLI